MKFKTLSCVTVTALVLGGCNSSSDDNVANVFGIDDSQIRVTHASADAPLVSILLDGAVVSGLDKVDYQQGSGLLGLGSGSHDLIVRGLLAGGATTDVITANGVNFAPDMQYDVFAVNSVASIEPVILSRSSMGPSDSEVRLDVLHAAPGVPAVDIYLTTADSIDNESPAVSGLEFKIDSADLPVTVPAGEYRVRITVSGDKAVAFDSGNLPLAGGSDLMVTAVPNVSGGVVSPVNLLVADGSTVSVLRNTVEKATVRVGHAVNTAPNVDVLASGGVVTGLSNIAYETIKSTDVAAGSYDLQVTETGTTTPALISAPGTQFTAGSETIIFAVGPASSIEALPIVEDLRSVATYAKLKVVHANSVAGLVDIHATPAGQGFSESTVVLPGVNFKDSAVLNVDAGTYDFAVAQAGTLNVLLSASNVTLGAGNVATAFATETAIALNVDK
ncbi:DUF4397 domain-containing protein [Vibrio sp. ZSDZ34]|uniref:DUF4397 domain-containing protein n=1 Tax=Vibrio gelatinilyticus TaxID=2893468 RepID=A0A9X1WB55_9VIBR|nr:DUF4397 domain-containing protein [Vibrio gelatinilyticus]MCJ2375360.1 DUF4397 domain-containing protein [Vibrio gelatinilyticus]